VTARRFVDTNIFVYVHDHSDHRSTRAKELLDRVEPSSIVVSPQVIGEFYVTVTRKLSPPLTDVAARRAVDDLANFIVVPIDGVLVQAAVARAQRSQISYRDALIVEAARAGGCSELLTEDLAAGTNFDGMTVVNPFA
jgi:predicted nucleic acid-binding protein